MKSVYLAGPDVFLPEAGSHASQQKALCREHGFEPRHPLDQTDLSSPGIFRTNVSLIRNADAVVANLNPFRGAEVDSGTAFEIGCAIALGKRVIAYLDDTRPQVDKLADWYGQALSHVDRCCFDPTGLAVENFGLPVNLMLAVPCTWVRGSLEDALQVL